MSELMAWPKYVAQASLKCGHLVVVEQHAALIRFMTQRQVRPALYCWHCRKRSQAASIYEPLCETVPWAS